MKIIIFYSLMWPSQALAESVTPRGGGITIGQLIMSALGKLGFIFGGLAMLFIIYGAFQFMTANGDPTKLSTARKTIFYALIGALLIAISYLLVNFIQLNVDCLISPSGDDC